MFIMLDSQQKRKLSHILYHKATLVILLLVTLFVLRSTWIVWQKKEESDELKNISLKYKKGLEARDMELNTVIEKLGTEAGKEAEIRSKFNVAKNGETVVLITDEASDTLATTTSQGFWQKVGNLFK